VAQERRKKGNKLGNKKAGGPQLNANKGFPVQPQVVQPIPKAAPADPLLKMQQEKELKRLEDQKKKEYEDKKNVLKAKQETKKA
jgi:hypothetical protein